LTAKWYAEAISPNAINAINALKKIPILNDFYLAGGTACALQLGHRLSVDLDFFSSKFLLDFYQREELKNYLKANHSLKIREEAEGTLHIELEATAVSFLRYNYPVLKPFKSWQGLQIAALEDIALMKLGAVISRGAKKDFFDLYEICQYFSLIDLFKLAKKKFRDASDFALQASRALVYFDDALNDPSPRLLKPLDWDKIQSFFEKETPKAVKILLG